MREFKFRLTLILLIFLIIKKIFLYAIFFLKKVYFESVEKNGSFYLKKKSKLYCTYVYQKS